MTSPAPIPDGTWVDNQVDAVDLRRSLGASLVIPANATAPRPGRLMGPGNPLDVSPTNPPSRAVLIKAGKAHTYRSAAYGPVLGVGPDGDVTLPMPSPPASGSQWRRVYVLQRDTAAPANDAATGAVIGEVVGAASASPAKPTLPAGALLIGEVLDTAGAATITTGMVTNVRSYTAPRGGILPFLNKLERDTYAAPYPTLECLELDTGRRLWHDGTRWRYLGDTVTVTGTAERDALTAYAGLRAVTAAGLAWQHNGTAWRITDAPAARLPLLDTNALGGTRAPVVWAQDRTVHVNGLAYINANLASGGRSQIATIPADLRPPTQEVLPVMVNGWLMCSVDVYPDGRLVFRNDTAGPVGGNGSSGSWVGLSLTWALDPTPAA